MGTDNSKPVPKVLSEDHIDLLLENTSFNKEEILDWHNGFLKDCPTGRMNKEKFNELYCFLFPNGNSRKFCKQIFKTFDPESTGEIEFNELMFSISLTTTGDVRKKINIAFRIYDIDHNGLIDKKELTKIIRAIYDLSDGDDGRDLTSEDVRNVMKQLDKNNDEFISKEEFIDGCLNNPKIVEILFPVL